LGLTNAEAALPEDPARRWQVVAGDDFVVLHAAGAYGDDGTVDRVLRLTSSEACPGFVEARQTMSDGGSSEEVEARSGTLRLQDWDPSGVISGRLESEFAFSFYAVVPPREATAVVRSLADVVPEGARELTGKSLDEGGTFRCVEDFELRPGLDSPICEADGWHLRGRLGFTARAEGSVEVHNAAPLRVSRQHDCGQETAAKAADAALAREILPDVAPWPGGRAAERLPTSPLCRASELQVVAAPSVLISSVEGRVRLGARERGSAALRVAGMDVANWSIGRPAGGGCDRRTYTTAVHLEVVCTGRWAVVTSTEEVRYAPPGCPGELIGMDDGVSLFSVPPQVPASLPCRAMSGNGIGPTRRLRVGLDDGIAHAIELPQLRVAEE
jgi:hypothetical protein